MISTFTRFMADMDSAEFHAFQSGVLLQQRNEWLDLARQARLLGQNELFKLRLEIARLRNHHLLESVAKFRKAKAKEQRRAA